jgi:putative Mg2+ transporter-C (MgtC) family protein
MVGAERAEALSSGVDAARHRMISAILTVLDSAGQRLNILDRDNVAGLERTSFAIIATRKVHNRLVHELRESDATDQVVVFRDTEEE